MGNQVKLSSSGVRKIILIANNAHIHFHHADSVNVITMACLFTQDPADKEAAIIRGELYLHHERIVFYFILPYPHAYIWYHFCDLWK